MSLASTIINGFSLDFFFFLFLFELNETVFFFLDVFNYKIIFGFVRKWKVLNFR